MGEINIPRGEQDALAAINMDELDDLVGQAIRYEQECELYRLPLSSCGPYVSTRLHYFDQALTRHRRAKAPKKRTETENALRDAGRELLHAVGSMRQRMEIEKKENQLFVIEDQITPPHRFRQQLSVAVFYHWRRSADGDWTFGDIEFRHSVDLRPDYSAPVPKRKPSAAKQEQELQDKLYQTWEHLKRGSLFAVRDYFRDGGDGSKIPKTFQVIVDARGGLNNYSMDFWKQNV